MYPDIVGSRIEIVSESTAVDIKSTVKGKIESIFIDDEDSVSKFQDLTLVENTAEYKDISKVKEKLEGFISFMNSYELSNIPQMDGLITSILFDEFVYKNLISKINSNS